MSSLLSCRRCVSVLVFLVLAMTAAGRVLAETPATKPATAKPTDAEVAKAQARVAILVLMQTQYRAEYQETDMKLMRLRMQATALGYVGPGRPSTLELRLIEALRALRVAEKEHRASRIRLEDVRTALGAGEDPVEVVKVVRADPRVRELQHRVDEAEIRLAIAAKSGVPVSPMEIERDVLVKRLADLRSETTTEARASVLDSLMRHVAAVGKEQKTREEQVDQYTQDMGEMNNQLSSLRYAEKSQDRLIKKLWAIDDELVELNANILTPYFGALWDRPPRIDEPLLDQHERKPPNDEIHFPPASGDRPRRLSSEPR
jgi:Na+-transporting methylmalonyl-CoA/oxaloacetate decarboxylase gamma subunit